MTWIAIAAALIIGPDIAAAAWQRWGFEVVRGVGGPKYCQRFIIWRHNYRVLLIITRRRKIGENRR